MKDSSCGIGLKGLGVGRISLYTCMCGGVRERERDSKLESQNTEKLCAVERESCYNWNLIFWGFWTKDFSRIV